MTSTITHSTAFKSAIFFLVLLTFSGAASAAPTLDAVSFDPAFISAGDRVNISANMHEPNRLDKTWDEDKRLKVVLKPGNRLTREYVTIEDDRDDSVGFLFPDAVWNQRFQVKVGSGAPTGMYDFELHMQYLENGEPVKIQTEDGEYNVTIIRSFSMPVDSEGVDISSNVLRTEPSIPRPGDDYVETYVRFTNTGNKPVEEIDIRPSTPENIVPAYSSDEKFYVNKLMEGGSAEKTVSLKLDEDLEAGLHIVNLSTTYEDESGNRYSKSLGLPLRVEGRPDLELVSARTEMRSGETSDLRVQVENTGEQDAESVTARIITERAQPFSLNDRSSYIGEIESGETGEAVMALSSERNGALKTHQVKVQLRANGDSEEGDHSVYTFTEQADVELIGRTLPVLPYAGVAAAVLVALGAGYRYRRKKRRENPDGSE